MSPAESPAVRARPQRNGLCRQLRRAAAHDRPPPQLLRWPLAVWEEEPWIRCWGWREPGGASGAPDGQSTAPARDEWQ